MRALLIALALVPSFALAQSIEQQDLAPPAANSSIVPPGTPPAIYTTHQQQPQYLPWQKTQAPAAPGAYQPAHPLMPAQSPFGRPSAPNPQGTAVSGPSNQAVPVQGVEAGEAAAPVEQQAAPLPPGTNPAEENPATPSVQTSPIFPTDASGPAPRKVVFRALNKVTGRSDLLEAKPGETVSFDRLDITAVTCQRSIPDSPLDYAGLFDLREHIPGQAQTKPLFRGWMYASSPSISSLEHPIYDVTMVKCEMAEPPPPAPEKKAPAKKSK